MGTEHSSNAARTGAAHDALGRVARAVSRAHRAMCALRMGEAALWSLATFLTALAAVAWMGDRAYERDGFVLAAVLAGAALVALVRSTVPRPADTAAALDRRSGARFALVAAFERATSGRATELDGLLGERVLDRLPRGDTFAGSSVTIVPAVVAPLLGAALLALAVAPRAGSPARPAELASAAAETLARAVASSVELDARSRAEFTELVAELRRVAREANVSPDAAARLADVQAELARRSAELDPLGALARASESAGLKLAAAERRAAAPQGREPIATDALPTAPETVNGAAGVSGAAPTTTATGAPAGTEGTANGDVPLPDGDSLPKGVVDASGPEEAAWRGAWLEPQERALVEAWNEARRARALSAAE